MPNCSNNYGQSIFPFNKSYINYTSPNFLLTERISRPIETWAVSNESLDIGILLVYATLFRNLY
jgi:hypothetical protein